MLTITQTREILIAESNVQPVRCPVTVCGDIHGQFVRSNSRVYTFIASKTAFDVPHSTTSPNCFESGATRLTPTISSWATMSIEDTTLSKPSPSSSLSNSAIATALQSYEAITNHDRSPKSTAFTTNASESTETRTSGDSLPISLTTFPSPPSSTTKCAFSKFSVAFGLDVIPVLFLDILPPRRSLPFHRHPRPRSRHRPSPRGTTRRPNVRLALVRSRRSMRLGNITTGGWIYVRTRYI